MCNWFKKKTPVEPERLLPTSTKMVTRHKIEAIFRQRFPDGHLYLSDKERYLLCSYDDIALFLAQDGTNKYDSEYEVYDCDDYALRLAGQFSIPTWSALALGIMWTELHALNLFITEDEELLFIEPQLDEIQEFLEPWQGKTNRFAVI